MAEVDEDPIHPILTDSYTWEIIEFTYRPNSADWREAFIDLLFSRNDMKRRLRFHGPKDIQLPQGIMGSWCRVAIFDVARRQLEDIRVRVIGYEPDWCVPSFWALFVTEIV